jgi:hypothetical protein
MRPRRLFLSLFADFAPVLAKATGKTLIIRMTQSHVASSRIFPSSFTANSREGIVPVRGTRLSSRAIRYGTIAEKACRPAGMEQAQGKR